MAADVDIDPGLAAELDVVARQVVRAKRKLRKPAPSEVDLATALKDIVLGDTIQGSSTLTLQICDDDYELRESGFFDANRDGRLDAIDLNYPDGSRFWWRLTQIGDEGGADVEMVFWERAAAHLDDHQGPLKVSRAKKTRAEFLKMLADRVKAGGGINLRSRELHVKQPIAKPEKTDSDRKANKDGGINRSETITFTNWDGNEYTFKPGELNNAEKSLDAAFEHTDDERPLLALVCAEIVEAPFFRNPRGGDASSAGILQLLASHGALSMRRDIARVVEMFLTEGFTGRGGAIDLAKQHKDWSPGQIAQAVQGSAHPSRYDKVKDGAEQILEAYGGTGGGGTYRKQFNFEVGSADDPHETFWDAANRLAEEVKWALFLDGQEWYFDSEMTLIRQKPALIVRRGDPAVIKVSGTWDARHVATECVVELVCDAFEFRAGEVFKLEGYGAFSTGSTAKLPGRWLIAQIDRPRSSLVSTFTLKQPQRPAPEPAPATGQRPDDESASASGLKEACQAISDQNRPYVYGGGHGPKLRDIGRKDGLDCSSSCSLALYRAEMFDGDVAITSGDFARSWGAAGRGKEFTVWANAGHVFIQSERDGEKWRFDTGGGPPSGPHVRGGHRSTSGFTPRHWGGGRKGDQPDDESSGRLPASVGAHRSDN